MPPLGPSFHYNYNVQGSLASGRGPNHRHTSSTHPPDLAPESGRRKLVAAPPAQSTEQELEAKPDAHVHVPSLLAPSAHEPWPEHGVAAPPGHSTEQSLVAKPSSQAQMPLPDAPSSQTPLLPRPRPSPCLAPSRSGGSVHMLLLATALATPPPG